MDISAIKKYGLSAYCSTPERWCWGLTCCLWQVKLRDFSRTGFRVPIRERYSLPLLDYYLGEFNFRFNRRTSRYRGKLFYRLLKQAVVTPPVMKHDIREGRFISWTTRYSMYKSQVHIPIILFKSLELLLYQ